MSQDFRVEVRSVQDLVPWALWHGFRAHVLEDLENELSMVLQAEGLTRHGGASGHAARSAPNSMMLVEVSCLVRMPAR